MYILHISRSVDDSARALLS